MRATWYLVARVARANRVRHVLVTIVVALSLSTFSLMTELSRASTADLDAALADDVGRHGTIALEFTDPRVTLGDDFGKRVSALLAPVSPRDIVWVRSVDGVPSTCPPYEATGESQLLAVTDGDGRPVRLGSASAYDGDARYCLSGQAVPLSAVYNPTEAEQRDWGAGLAVDTRYLALVVSSSTEPVRQRFVVQVPDPDRYRSAVTQAIEDEFGWDAGELGVDVRSLYHVRRVDDADGSYRAARAVGVVYETIGWGVVALAGVSLLVTQLLTERSRAWSYGLSMALGATRRRVAALVFGDALVAVAGGAALAVAVLLAGGPIAASFAQATFAVEYDTLSWRVVAQMIGAAAVIVLVGAAAPAVRASRRDPLDTLEPNQ